MVFQPAQFFESDFDTFLSSFVYFNENYSNFTHYGFFYVLSRRCSIRYLKPQTPDVVFKNRFLSLEKKIF